MLIRDKSLYIYLVYVAWSLLDVSISNMLWVIISFAIALVSQLFSFVFLVLNDIMGIKS